MDRLNGAIAALRSGKPAFATFCAADPGTAQALAGTAYDAIVFEMEHGGYDIGALRTALQYLLDRRQIADSGSIAPAVTPLVRIPPNGGEMNQWIAKQVLDAGVYGIIWPHVSTVAEARNAVASCRYPRPREAPRFEPAGQRGDAPTVAARYWGLTQQQYYAKSDVWPIDPDGEILVGIMCEDVAGLRNLRAILREVPGIGVVIIGEGDLSQELGVPRQYDHPTVVAAMDEILGICREAGVACGHPHVDTANVARVTDQGFRWLMPAPVRSFAALEEGRRLAGR
jgi:4-hydroxy-2-oxoheptanedioate aldolase